ncbi:DUF1493 family protein [Serratia ficaria]|uniref:DUF1493 family protein n=1 Tax=Serratia ficaria TaxID=61651 RepID=UPI00218368C1|nr:DUF1493 family protein [Serratia ficaria]CAI2439863.1 Protein of uncharacterised function (DUF1493) [Serratia ficaria]
MVDEIEQRVYALVRKHDGVYLFKEQVLTPDTDLDTDLQLEDDEAEALMNEFFELFRVDKGNFAIDTYYPPDPPLRELLNPFKNREIPTVPDFTINMLIESAKAGRWLY